MVGGCTGHAPREEAPQEEPARPVPPVPPVPPVEVAEPPVEVAERVEVERCFAERSDQALPHWPLNGSYVDVDADGRRDVLVNFSLERQVGVLLQDGEGGLREQRTLELQHDAVGLSVGDFDGDQRVDLAAADYQGQSVRVYLGRGDGTFDAKPRETQVGKYVGAGAVGDFDGDGRVDLAVTLWSALGVLRGRGDGSFEGPRRLASGQAPESPLALDVDGDGRVDLVTPSNDEHHLAVFKGRGKGRFSAATRTPCGIGGHALAAGDFDRDGAIDLAMVNTHSSDVCVFLGDGAGGFRIGSVLAAGRTTHAVAVADLTGEGILDLVVVAWWSAAAKDRPTSRGDEALQDGVLLVFAGNGYGAFSEVASARVGVSPNEVWLDDLDGDGHREALVLNSNGRSLTRLRGVACAGR